ncbi:putative glycoside hydrolase [Thermogutta sp.]|uniref:putative glycoside hydrolase n=1 Tax=Thermogutta sp. TaxID=1962930 RepID=UPI0025EC592A|nr:putative glycoside hydrolase [Thermogutta sp.]
MRAINLNWLFGLMVAVAGTAPARAGDFPLFSWDRVPVYAHVGKASDDFTPEQLDFLAKHFNFITIEKDQASHKHGSTEKGFAVAAREIKKRNPNAKVLFYWNASLDTSSNRGRYEAMETFPQGGFLTDPLGQIIKRRGAVPNYDLTREDVRHWWSDVAAKAVTEYGADGIFADAMDQREEKGLTPEKIKALTAARVALLEETRRKIGPHKLIIYNGLMKGDAQQLLQFADGAMIESFCHPSYGDSKEVLVEYFEATRAAAQAGKIVILKGWPGFTFRWKEMMARPYAELAQLARERITFPLACFLIAAERNCYFCYSWGYREFHGTFEWYPEFDKPLGPPKGPAQRSGWIFRREFEHASVFVDLEHKVARIDWKP